MAGISLPAAAARADREPVDAQPRSSPQGFDILAPFPLPWTARRVRLEPGRALVDFYQ